MAAATESQHHEALDDGAASSRSIIRCTVNFGLKQLHSAIAIEDLPRRRLADVRHHLDVFAGAAEEDPALLDIRIVNHLLILFPTKVGLSAAEFCRRFIHSVQDFIEAGSGGGGLLGLPRLSGNRGQHAGEQEQQQWRVRSHSSFLRESGQCYLPPYPNLVSENASLRIA